jgi:hypothetical protein
MLAYYGTTVRSLPRIESQLREQIWTDYVQRMVARKGDATRYPLASTTAQLNWLAQQMRAHNQTIFSLELLQPDWLPASRRYLYHWSVVLVIALLFGLLFGPLFELVTGLHGGLHIGSVAGLHGGLLAGLVGGLIFGLLTGLFVGLAVGSLQPHLFWLGAERRRNILPLLRYFRYDWKCAATCSKRATVICSLTPIYLL